MIQQCLDTIRQGGKISFERALELAQSSNAADLYTAADEIRRYFHGSKFDLCSIINAKSGKCSENCKFCAQSSHFNTEIEVYDIIDENEAVLQGKDNDDHGVERISLVTAGKTASVSDISQYGKIYKRLSEETCLKFCASMGMLTEKKAHLLKSYGVERYHCNLEACREFFPTVCTTHTWEEKVTTIEIARDAGMDVCSGGIIGMGETLEQRIRLAIELRELNVYSIPINVLTPIENTPFEKVEPLSISDVLLCIAIFRFINPHAVVRLAGGRSQLGDDQYRCFTSGANGAIVGNYLTTLGNTMSSDLKSIEEQGFSFKETQDE